MVATLGRNFSHQVAEAAFFELGRVFGRGSGQDDSREEDRLCIGLMGPVGRGATDKRRAVAPAECFSWLKGVVAGMLTSLRVEDVAFQRHPHPFFEEGAAMAVRVDGGEAGILGLIRREVGQRWRISLPVAVAELGLARIVAHVFDQKALHPVPPYPAVLRDVALVVDECVQHEDIMAVVRRNAPDELTDTALFDIFRGEGVEGGKKSLAYSFTYQSQTRTLTDEDANSFHEAVKDALRRDLNVVIRED
jgi:phenylalanyl-tRNA synthetase beta chain